MSSHIMDPRVVAALTDNALQMAEARNEANRHGARVSLSLSDEQLNNNCLMIHYRDCGRAKVFRDVHDPLNYWGTGLVIGCDPILLPLKERERALWEHYCSYHPEVEPYDLNLIVVAQTIIDQVVYRNTL